MAQRKVIQNQIPHWNDNMEMQIGMQIMQIGMHNSTMFQIEVQMQARCGAEITPRVVM